MVSYRAFHPRFLKKRQGLSGVLGGLFPGGSSSSSTAGHTTASASSSAGDPGGIIGGFTSLIGGIDPQSSSATSSTASVPLTHSSSGSTGSTTTTSASRSSASPSTSAFSTSADLTTPSPTPSATSSASDVVYTSSDGTSIVYITSTPPAPSSTAAAPTSFLNDPSLEGGVFTLVGIVALVIIFVVITWTLRKRRRDRLERDLAAAVTFDPGATDMYERHEASFEKHRLSGSSSGHGHGYGYGMSQMAFVPQMDYHGPTSYGPYAATGAYGASYPGSSPAPPQPTAQGGANLTRKFSDRKPVPLLLPDPTYDPANANVAILPQFHQT